MNVKGWAITAGIGAAAGAVAVLMMPSGRKGCQQNGGCGLEGFRQHFQQDGFHGYVKNSREAEASRVIFALFSLILLAQQIQLPPE